jgi:hypothetical protein
MKLTNTIFALIFIAAFSISALAQTAAKNSGLFWVRENGKYGYIDRTGKTVIAPQFENTMGFNEGLAATKLNGKYGFINTKGEWVIKPQFDFTYVFMDGLAMVRVGKQYAWIDRTGKTVIAPTDYEAVAMGFSEGRLAVKRSGKWGYIDKTGKLVIDAKFHKAAKFEGGLAQVETPDGMHHWIAPEGKIVWSQKKDETKL